MNKNIIMLPTKPGRRILTGGMHRLLCASLFLLFSVPALAVVTTHDLQASFKGYSIEQVPGASEFVAVGTVYGDAGLNSITGYHFMHLDANGNVLQSWYRYPMIATEFRVVDVAVEDADNYWVVMAARGVSQDFCYAEKASISVAGVSTTWPWEVNFRNGNDPMFANLYPTHSVYNDGHLYICGYVSRPVGLDTPTATSPGKKGMMSVTDVNPVTNPPGTIPTTNLALWESLSTSPGVADFDMALKIKYVEPNFYVTGAGNSADVQNQQSGTIFINFTGTSLGTVGSPSVNFLPASALSDVHGIHGIDVINQNGNVLLLNSEFLQQNIISWGVMRIDPATGLPNTSVTAYEKTTTTTGAWPKQFLMHPTDPDNNPLNIVGETPADFSSCSVAGMGINPPSFTNINPFILNANITWNSATGLNVGSTGMVIHASNDPSSTSTPLVDHNHAIILTGYRHNIENETRLHTFAYRYADNTPDGSIALIYPKRSATYNNYLNTKFMTTDANGHEQDCGNEWTCQPVFTPVGVTSNTFGIQYVPATVLSHVPTATVHVAVQTDNCQNDAYKTTSVSGAASASEGVELYPNPAVSELNIKLPSALAQGDEFAFSLTDVTGRIVYHTKTFNTGTSVVTVNLNQLPSGMYVSRVNVNGKTYTDKVVIE